jgi:type I restriction enzyme S subunit
MVVSTGFAVVRPADDLTTDYAAYALRAPYFVERIVANSKGVSFPAINESEMATYELASPSESEQGAIAAFLDRETARIDALVAKKERLIALLEEQRTALITRAVTKGLDPTVPMKDSGVEWLGEIPAHWEVKKWRYCCHVTEGQVAPDDDRFRDRILIAPNHIESGTGRILYTETADEQGAISGKYLVAPGDIIYSKIRPALNKVCIAGGHWLCSADMYPLAITEKRLQARFLLYFMLSEPFVRLMVDESMRVAMPKVNREKLAACPLIIPNADEQRAIAAFLDRETARIDALVAKVRDAIERLKELRTALISAAVTGKIDVREEVAT